MRNERLPCVRQPKHSKSLYAFPMHFQLAPVMLTFRILRLSPVQDTSLRSSCAIPSHLYRTLEAGELKVKQQRFHSTRMQKLFNLALLNFSIKKKHSGTRTTAAVDESFECLYIAFNG